MTTEHALELLSSWRDQMALDGFATDTEIQDYDKALETLACAAEDKYAVACRIITAIRHWIVTDGENHQPLGELLNALEKEIQQ